MWRTVKNSKFHKKKHQDTDVLDLEGVKYAMNAVFICAGVDLFLESKSTNSHGESKENSESTSYLNDVVNNLASFNKPS